MLHSIVPGQPGGASPLQSKSTGSYIGTTTIKKVIITESRQDQNGKRDNSRRDDEGERAHRTRNRRNTHPGGDYPSVDRRPDSYFQVRQTLMDLYPESNEASFAKYFAMKLAGHAGLEKYYREKVALGMKLGLPQEVILETLTEGLPLSDQRLVRVVPPESLGEWFQLGQRIHGPSAPTARHHEVQPPNLSGPYTSTPRRTVSADINQLNTRARGQCNQPNIHSRPNIHHAPNIHHKTKPKPPETPQPFANQMNDRMIRSVVLAVLLSFMAESTPFLERSFNTIGCKGEYDEAKYVRLVGVCTDCYKVLYGNHWEVQDLCKTIFRRLVANGLHSCRPLRRLPLTPPNRRQRLEWCRARSTRMTEWHRVVFSDESRFCLSSDSRRVRVWRRRGERSNPAAIVERPTVRQRGIMVLGAIAYDSRSPLLRIQGTMTAHRYVDDVLRPVTLPYLQGVPNALYQQDNARPHTSRISQQALQDVQMLPWPPYSPDLLPIEHVWDIIGRRLHALPQPRSEDELWQMMTDWMIRGAILAVLLSFVAGSTPLLERRFNAIGCKGEYDSAKYARLERLCNECYTVLFRDNREVPALCKTISRRLVANGLHSCRPLRRLPLTPPNRRQRLEWCRARSTWMTEWHRVVFSDESRFCLSSESRRVRVWRRRGERSNPAAIVERPTVRQRGIMVWGAIAYDSRSPLLRIQGTMTAQRYVDDVLRPVTLPYLQGVPNDLYQQDNARQHTARISQQALQDVQMLPWPPYSPDLSPIEHVWDIIGRRLHALPQPSSEDELWQMRSDCYLPLTPVYFLEDSRKFYQLLSPVQRLLYFTVLQLKWDLQVKPEQLLVLTRKIEEILKAVQAIQAQNQAMQAQNHSFQAQDKKTRGALQPQNQKTRETIQAKNQAFQAQKQELKESLGLKIKLLEDIISVVKE
ncbi:ITP [Cordylochernes scorpioides]|uniref:ITP n=1 Tax=Cordylochernes scorpioides TaxID=51811 RepID=A0ABY6KRD6_9ARAC|nr:ITP [Cordylochernes scorpioides]